MQPSREILLHHYWCTAEARMRRINRKLTCLDEYRLHGSMAAGGTEQKEEEMMYRHVRSSKGPKLQLDRNSIFYLLSVPSHFCTAPWILLVLHQVNPRWELFGVSFSLTFWTVQSLVSFPDGRWPKNLVWESLCLLFYSKLNFCCQILFCWSLF